jgi:predicted CopG family antitoxin
MTTRGNYLQEAISLKLDVYEHLLRINAAFDQVIRSLVALQKHRQFHRDELARFRRHSKETRASLNSYLVATVEWAETAEAGRRFHDRLAQEKNDEGEADSGG